MKVYGFISQNLMSSFREDSVLIGVYDLFTGAAVKKNEDLNWLMFSRSLCPFALLAHIQIPFQMKRAGAATLYPYPLG